VSFGKDVNDYYNSFITLADANAAGFFAATLTVGAGVLKLNPPTTSGRLFQWLAIVLLGAALAACAHVVFPRLPSGRRGLIFWEDVRTFNGHEAYQKEIARLTEAEIEQEYAAQNFFVAEVVHKKHYWVRWAIVLFLVGAGFGVMAYSLG
jgi:hypothetical protein